MNKSDFEAFAFVSFLFGSIMLAFVGFIFIMDLLGLLLGLATISAILLITSYFLWWKSKNVD